MNLNPGSTLWLVAHDVRLNWRRFAGMWGDLSPRNIAAAVTIGLVVIHAFGAAAAPYVAARLFTGGGLSELATVLVCMFTWMIAQGLFATTRTIYDRGDLDLLVGSPSPSDRIFTAKALAVAAGTFGSVALLVLPIANAGAALGKPQWLAAYPLLVAMALGATALSIGTSLGLFFLLGPRRARTWTQIIGAAIGGGFVLFAQIVAVLPRDARERLAAYLSELASYPVVRLPVAAATGDVAANLAMLTIGLIMFVLAGSMLGDRFARAALAAAGGSGATAGREASGGAAFRSGARWNLVFKEWRILMRDPGIYAQLGLQVVYTVPIAVVLLRNGSLPTAFALAPTIVVVTAQIAASLAWLTISGEDAPELIATAPVTGAMVDRSKLLAVALPVAMIMTPAMIGLAFVSPAAAAIAFLFCVGAASSTAYLNFKHPMPGNRRGILRRHAQSKVIGLVEHALSVLWAVAVVLALGGIVLWVIPALLAAAISAAAGIGSSPARAFRGGPRAIWR